MVKLDLGALQKINNTAILSEETPISAPTVENITPVENIDSAPQKPKISLSKLMWVPETPKETPVVEAEKIPEIKLEIKEAPVEIISEAPNAEENLIPKIEEANFVLTEQQEEALLEEEIAEEIVEVNNSSESIFIQDEKPQEKDEEVINSTGKEFFPNFDLGKEFNLFDDEEENKTTVTAANPIEVETPDTQIINSQEEIAIANINNTTEEISDVANLEQAEIPAENTVLLNQEEVISTVDLTETKAETEEIIDLNNITETAITQENSESEPTPGTPEYVNKVKTDLSSKRLLGWIKSFNKKVVISTLSGILVVIWIFGFMNFSNFWDNWKANINENTNSLTNSWTNNAYVEWVDYFIVTTRKSNPKAKKTTTNTWALNNTWTTNTETPETTSSWATAESWAVENTNTWIMTPNIQ